MSKKVIRLISPFQMLWSLRRKVLKFVMSIRMRSLPTQRLTKTIRNCHWLTLTMSKNTQIPRDPSSSMRGSTLRNTLNKGKSLLKLPSMEKPRSAGRLPLKESETVTQLHYQKLVGWMTTTIKQSPILFLLIKVNKISKKSLLKIIWDLQMLPM